MEIVSESPVALAWMGDAIFTCRVRDHLLKKGYRKADTLQKLSAKYNSAFGQSNLLKRLEEEDWMNEDEAEIVRRGRNAHPKTIAKNADPKTYLNATALEALVGYLYLYHHEQRMNELLDLCMEWGEPK